MHLHPIKILGSHMDTISVSFPVNPRPDVGAPVNRHSKSPMDAKRALIGRAAGPDDLESVRARRGVPKLLFDQSKYLIICTEISRVIQI